MFDGPKLAFNLSIGPWVGIGSCLMLNALHILCTSWLTNSLSETKTSGGPILYIQLVRNASLSFSCVLPFIAIAMMKAKKWSANPRMYLYPSFDWGIGPTKSKCTTWAANSFSFVLKQCSNLTSFCILCFYIHLWHFNNSLCTSACNSGIQMHFCACLTIPLTPKCMWLRWMLFITWFAILLGKQYLSVLFWPELSFLSPLLASVSGLRVSSSIPAN